MRRVTKNILILIFGVTFAVLYCEFLIYYVVIVQCSWPILANAENVSTLKALMIADTHLLGPRRGHWFDKMRREWQMYQAFQAIVYLHNPDVVFILGDLFDEGEWTNNREFKDYVERFNIIFAIPENVNMYVTAGNHDIGFHHYIRPGFAERFYKSLNTSTVELVTLKNSHFILINSMAMEGDSCYLCLEAKKKIKDFGALLDCSDNPAKCKNINTTRVKYSRPILLQIPTELPNYLHYYKQRFMCECPLAACDVHAETGYNSTADGQIQDSPKHVHFPLYRLSDALCTEPDAPPLPERKKLFRLKIDALSKEATKYLVSNIKPRVAFGGHTHHGCLVQHSYEIPESIHFNEYSIPSFSWRNRPDPKYMLVSITPNDYGVNKCGLPKETTIVITAVLLLVIIFWYTFTRRSIGR